MAEGTVTTPFLSILKNSSVYMVGKCPSSGLSWIFWIRLCFSIIYCISVYIAKHELKALNQHFLQQSQFCALATTVDKSYHIIIKLLKSAAALPWTTRHVLKESENIGIKPNPRTCQCTWDLERLHLICNNV